MKARKSLFTRILTSIFLVLFVSVNNFSQNKIDDLQPTLILISLDGYRYDYSKLYKPENIVRFSSEGVQAKWMTPSFPTKTFPNHYTVVTGLYPQNHGIVENNVWDFGVVFSMSNRDEVQNGRWWLGEPFWVTAAKNGIKTGAFFFPGTEAEINGTRPMYWLGYEHEKDYGERVDTILSWIDKPLAERPQFFTLYFDEPDSAGHAFGPGSEEAGKAVQRVDSMIGRLITGLKDRGIYDEVNIIIVSDHGMAKVDPTKAIILDEKTDLTLADRIIWSGEIVQIFPKDGKTSEMMAGLKKVKGIKCWEKAQVPARLHYSSGPRVAPVICSPKLGLTISSREYFERMKQRPNWERIRGAHGFDNKYKEMRAFFAARGSAFKQRTVVKPFQNVDVYNLLCNIFNIQPAKNDGDMSRIKGVLSSEK